MSYKYQRNASCSCQDHVTIGSVQYVVADVMTFTPDKVPCGDNMDDLVMYYQDLHQLLDPELLITSTYQIWKQRGHVFCESVFLAWNLAIRSLSHQVYARPFRKTILHSCLALLDLLAALDKEFIREDHHCDSFFPFGGLRFGLGVDLVMALIDKG